MTAQELIDLVMSQSDATNRTQILSDINEGYKILGKIAKIPAKAQVTVTTDYELYQLPLNLYRLEGVSISGVPLDKVDKEDIEGASQFPTKYYKEGNYIGIKSTTTQTATIDYLKYPDKLTDEAQELHEKIPDEYQLALVNFAIAKSKAIDGQFSAATYYMNMFDSARQELNQDVNNDDSAPQAIKDVYGAF